MEVVTYPQLVVSFNLALNDVLRTYFKDGGEINESGGSVYVERCELHYNRDNILDVSDRPKIAFLGDRAASNSQQLSPGKCTDGNIRVRVRRVPVERIVHVIIPRGKVFPAQPYTIPPELSPKTPGDKKFADMIWSQLWFVLRYTRAELQQRGIMSVTLDEFPQEKSDEQYIVNTGRMTAVIEYTMPAEPA